jgi:hypothetical protein
LSNGDRNSGKDAAKATPLEERAPATPLRGEIYRTLNGGGMAIAVLSPEELELRIDDESRRFKYTKEGDSFRVNMSSWDKTRVIYYKITEEGLRDPRGTMFLSPMAYEIQSNKQRLRGHLHEESDKAIEDANKNLTEARSALKGLLNDVDKLGLAAVRTREKAAGETAGNGFGKSSEAFRLAAKKLEEVNERNGEDVLKPFWDAKIKKFELYARGADLEREMIRLVLDDSIPDVAALAPKIKDMEKRRDDRAREAEKITVDAR